MMSIEGCARKKPLTPPLTNIEMKPKCKQRSRINPQLGTIQTANVQISTMMVDGMVMISVGKENASEENGFIPLTNM